MRHPFLILFLILIPFFTIGISQTDTSYVKDSLPLVNFRFDSIKNKNRKQFLTATLENLAFNILLNRYDANLDNKEWAKVSWQSWVNNAKAGTYTDFNKFYTNWMDHPIHGSILYNAARSSGYSYWGSAPFAIGGSLMWEYFGEKFPASDIDVYTTSIGGIYLGELTNRFSDIIRRKMAHKNKVLGHITTGLLNPMGEINTLLRINKNPLYHNPGPLLYSEFSIGKTLQAYPSQYSILGSNGYVNLSLIYGDLFQQTSAKYRPFDYFVFKSWADFGFNGQNNELYFNMLSHAPLLVKHINDHSVITLSQHYDFLTSSVFKIGSLAFTGDYYFQLFGGSNKWHFTSSIKGGIILFGSSKSDIINFVYQTRDAEFKRDYIYGRGYTLEAELLFKTQKLGSIGGNLNRWFIYTANDTKGEEDVMLFIIDYRYPIYKNIQVGLQANLYKRLGHYSQFSDFKNFKNEYYELKSVMTWQF
jgi:Domain of unknown function (DUF3943)